MAGGEHRRTHRKRSLVLLLISVICFILFITGLDELSSVTEEDVDACLNGETTPEELGLPDMTCEEISEAHEEDYYDGFIWFIGWCFCGVFGIMGIIQVAMTQEDSVEVRLAATEEESRMIQSRMTEMQSRFAEAERGYQKLLDAQLLAEERYRQAEELSLKSVSAHSALSDSASRGHLDSITELEEAAAKAREDMGAARMAAEEAERARRESEAVAIRVKAAEEELRRIADITASTGPNITYNIKHDERIYQDSVHQEEKLEED